MMAYDEVNRFILIEYEWFQESWHLFEYPPAKIYKIYEMFFPGWKHGTSSNSGTANILQGRPTFYSGGRDPARVVDGNLGWDIILYYL